MGFKIEDDLNTENSRKLWLEWKRRIDPEHYLDPKKRGDADDGSAGPAAMVRDGLIDPEGTSGARSTATASTARARSAASRRPAAWRGRFRAASATRRSSAPDSTWTARSAPPARPGRGEANLYNLCSFLIVEQMRLGKSPKDAGMEALRRMQKNTVEKRLLNARGLPNFSI